MASQLEPFRCVAEFIEGVILKELCAAEMFVPSKDCSAHRCDVARWRQIIEHFTPRLIEDVKIAISSSVPVLCDIDLESLVPDLHEYPSFPPDAPSLTLAQRRQLLGALEILLDSYLGTVMPGVDEELDHPLMPKQGLACIAAQVAALCEHLVLIRSLAPDANLDLDNIRTGGESSNAPVGSKQQILEEVQLVRQKNFDLEKKLATNGKIVDAWAIRGKIEADKRYHRLLNLNAMLEDKLRQRSDEHKVAVQESQNQSRRADHNLWLAEEKERKIDKLKAEMDKCYAMQDDLLKREREYGKKVLHASFAECDKTLRHEVRVQRLEMMMVTDGSPQTPRGTAQTPPQTPRVTAQSVVGATGANRSSVETDLTKMIKQASDKVMHEFEELFAARQNNIKEYVEKLEISRANLKHPEMTFQEFCKIRDSFLPQRRSAAVQTDPLSKFLASLSVTERSPSPGSGSWSKRPGSRSSAGGTLRLNQVLPPSDGSVTYRAGHQPAPPTRPYVLSHQRVFGARGLTPLPTSSRASKGVAAADCSAEPQDGGSKQSPSSQGSPTSDPSLREDSDSSPRPLSPPTLNRGNSRPLSANPRVNLDVAEKPEKPGRTIGDKKSSRRRSTDRARPSMAEAAVLEAALTRSRTNI